MASSIRRALFVCRGSLHDGMGHVTRTRTVAQEMSRRASVIVLVLGDPSVNNLLVGCDFEYRVFDDEQLVVETAQAFQPDVVFFDMLRFSQPSFDATRSGALAVSLSPIFDRLGQVDVVFNRTTLRGEDWPADESGPLLRCGRQYAVVDKRCMPISEAQFRRNLEQQALSVAISMGGTDASNKTLYLLEALKQIADPMLFWVLLGEGYVHSFQALVDCMADARQHEVILAKTNHSMWRILSSCSLAILGGGTTTYEAAFAGLPSINIVEDPRHNFLLRELVDAGISMITNFPLHKALRDITHALAVLNRQRARLLAMHQRAEGFIDGLGAPRIVEETCRLFQRAGRRRPLVVSAGVTSPQAPGARRRP